jgi:hypothetical protein
MPIHVTIGDITRWTDDIIVISTCTCTPSTPANRHCIER